MPIDDADRLMEIAEQLRCLATYASPLDELHEEVEGNVAWLDDYVEATFGRTRAKFVEEGSEEAWPEAICVGCGVEPPDYNREEGV